ncbi:hypothetical protein BC827DRAFT_1154663 [Russula dissimulans]|nr:hypothetical protein BC827DRAFT_1154663 [Russula dissimulans]
MTLRNTSVIRFDFMDTDCGLRGPLAHVAGLPEHFSKSLGHGRLNDAYPQFALLVRVDFAVAGQGAVAPCPPKHIKLTRCALHDWTRAADMKVPDACELERHLEDWPGNALIKASEPARGRGASRLIHRGDVLIRIRRNWNHSRPHDARVERAVGTTEETRPDQMSAISANGLGNFCDRWPPTRGDHLVVTGAFTG